MAKQAWLNWEHEFDQPPVKRNSQCQAGPVIAEVTAGKVQVSAPGACSLPAFRGRGGTRCFACRQHRASRSDSIVSAFCRSMWRALSQLLEHGAMRCIVSNRPDTVIVCQTRHPRKTRHRCYAAMYLGSGCFGAISERGCAGIFWLE